MTQISATIRQAVDMSGLSRSSIYLAMKGGKLPARKCGRRTLILVEDLQSFVKSLPAAGHGGA